jgi:hypothetical protein
MRGLSPSAGVLAKERWRLVRDAEREELLSTPIEVKAAQLASLMASVNALGWDDALAAEDEIVWRRWQALRAKQRG